MDNNTTSKNTKNTKNTKKNNNTKKKSAKIAKHPALSNLYRPDGMSLQEWQLALRKQQAEKESFGIREVGCGEFRAYNSLSRNEYKVVYRGRRSIWNYCSCLDFKTSQLGSCKHLEAVKVWIRKNHRKICTDNPAYTSVYVDYKGGRNIKIRIGSNEEAAMKKLAAGYFAEDGIIRDDAYNRFDTFLAAAKNLDETFRCYDDALDIILGRRERTLREQILEGKYPDSVLDKLLSVKLFPYQKEGVRFAVKAGKSIIADEMGLGKTVQAIAASEIFLREGLASNILVVCPTSLKYQWKKEIERFTGSTDQEGKARVTIVEGNPLQREKLYNDDATYKIVSYHSMCNDVRRLGRLTTDALVMDEIQRLKNWDTLISKAARKIESKYSVLLSGTPLENKLEELYANIELVDQFCLGPYYLFRNNHILTNPLTGGIAGYKNLNSVGEQISDRLIRRTKKGVRLQLPKRSDQFILVPMTKEQAAMHTEFRWDLTIILNKYERFHFITEADRKRIMLLLSQMRMVSDSTFILDPNPDTRHDIKVDEVMNLLDNIFANGDEKVVIFSEWERMTRLVAIELDKRGIRYEYFNGSVPAKQRGQMVDNFNTLSESRVFISTDAGSTGLNLQVAGTLINLDLPWNPAVLEQRISRIYRLGQDKPVQILNLVSKDSFEEGMIQRLNFKASMSEGVLDGGADTIFVDENKFKALINEINGVMAETGDNTANDYTDEESETPADKKRDLSQELAQDIQDFSESPVSPDTCSKEQSADSSAALSAIPEAEAKATPTATNTTTTTTTTAVTQTAQTTSADQTVPTASAASASASASAPAPASASASASAPASASASASGNPQQLIGLGVSFLSGLTEVLKSPEATKELVDNLVETDDTTGKTSIRIPVPDKETVQEVFTLFQKLFAK